MTIITHHLEISTQKLHWLHRNYKHPHSWTMLRCAYSRGSVSWGSGRDRSSEYHRRPVGGGQEQRWSVYVVGRRCVEECDTQQPTSQLLSQREQHRLKVMVHVIQNPTTNFQYLIPLNYLTMLKSCEMQLSTHTTEVSRLLVRVNSAKYRVHLP